MICINNNIFFAFVVSFSDSSSVLTTEIIAWEWDFGDNTYDTIKNPIHTYTLPGNYAVTLNITTSQGCINYKANDNAILIYPDPIAAFTSDPYETTILEPVYFLNQSTGATASHWNFGDGTFATTESPKHIYENAGTYTIYLDVVNEYGCRDTALREIIMLPAFTIYIPNAFTPNGDSKNEIFTVSGIGIKSYEMLVWNRWGNLIYKGSNCGWNGRMHNGDVAKQDVYVYRVYVEDIFNESHKLDGRVSLIK